MTLTSLVLRALIGAGSQVRGVIREFRFFIGSPALSKLYRHPACRGEGHLPGLIEGQTIGG